jgi:predicted dehydrogenase
VCDVKRDRRENARRRVDEMYGKSAGRGDHKGCTAYVDFRDLLARDDVDAVLIGTPIHWHAMMTVMAARAGKDVYCEKPTALTIEEACAARDAVHRYGRVFQAGTQQRSEYDGKFRQTCELVRAGRIGKLQSVYSFSPGGGFVWRRFGGGQAAPDGLDWDLWLGPAPWSQYVGSTDAHMFGFGGINWGQHHYDIVQWGIAGADDTGPVEIGWEDGKLALRYAGGVVVYACAYPGEAIGIEGGACFVGTEGRIVVDRRAIVSYPAEIARQPLGGGDGRLYYSTSHSGNFLDCVRTRKQTICNIDVAHRSASLLLLGGIAEQLKRPLRWDPAKDRFVNDPQADRLLSVAYRPPWRL